MEKNLEEIFWDWRRGKFSNDKKLEKSDVITTKPAPIGPPILFRINISEGINLKEQIYNAVTSSNHLQEANAYLIGHYLEGFINNLNLYPVQFYKI